MCQSHILTEWRNNGCEIQCAYADKQSANIQCTYAHKKSVENVSIKDISRKSVEKVRIKDIQVCPDLQCNSMKFPKPKQLLINEYPDIVMSNPELVKKMIQDIIFPAQNSSVFKYLEQTI